VTYGNEANSRITGNTLGMTPYTTGDDSVVWRCGLAGVPGTNTTIMQNATAATTNVDVQYLPASCRP